MAEAESEITPPEERASTPAGSLDAEGGPPEDTDLHQKLFLAHPDGVVVTVEGKIVLANERLAEMSGYSTQEAIGMAPSDLVVPEDQERLHDRIKDLHKQGPVYPSTYVLVCKDGSRLPIEAHSNPVQYQGQAAILSVLRDISPRRQAAEASSGTRSRMREELRICGEELRRITDTVDLAIAYVDLEQRYLFTNKAYEEWVKRPREEIEGKHIRDVLGEPVYEKIRGRVETALSGEPLTFEDVLPFGKKGLRHVAVTYRPYLGKRGKVEGFVALVNDITDLVTGLEQAKEAPQQGGLHAAASVGPEADMSGSRRRRSPADTIAQAKDASPQTGDARFPFVGIMTWLGIALAVIFYMGDSFLDAYAFGAGSFPTVLYDAEAKELWLRSFGVSLLVFLGVYAQITVTRRGQAEATLRASEHDLGERVKELNCLYGISKLVNMPGTSLQDILQGTADLIPPAWQYPEVTCARVILDGKAFKTATFHETEWGQTCDFSVHGQPAGSVEVYYLEEQPESDEGPFSKEERALIAVIAERLGHITEYRRAEEEIHTLNAELEQRVVERTAELEAANKELEEFSYSVSHDLRSPLRSIDGFSQILLDDCGDQLDEGGKDSLRRVRAAAQRMAQLIDDLLTLSLVTRGDMRREPVDLSSMARTIADELRMEDAERNAEFVIEERLTANVDPQLLRVVLENLLSNAWKFTSTHETARIEFGATRQQNGQTVYFVRDDGAGFDMAYADKLFVPFQRLHSVDEFPGNGVGLASVQHIIRRHRGHVWAEAGVEDGATFYFTL